METRNIRSVEQRTRTICLLILTAIAIGVALLYLRQVLVPFVLALFLTMAVTPVLDFLMGKCRLPRGFAIGLTMGLASFVLVFLGGLVSVGLAEVGEKREIYLEQVGGLITATDEVAGKWVGKAEEFIGFELGWFGGESSQVEAPVGTDPGHAVSLEQGGDSSQLGRDSGVQALKDKIPQMLEDAIMWAMDSGINLLSQGLLVVVFMMFLITGYRCVDEVDESNVRHQIRERVKEYLRVKILVSILTGSFTFVVLHVLEVDLALVFGLMAFFLNFIPNIGSLIAVVLPLPVIVLAPPELLTPGEQSIAFFLPALAQFLVGNILEPRWMGKSLDLNPVVILLSLIFWGVLWGPVGMLLSVPITAVIKMLLERSELTRPVAVLLSEHG